MYGQAEPRYEDVLRMGAIRPEEVDSCRKNVRVGDCFKIADMAWKGDQGKGERPIKCGMVIAKYPHLVTLDCGTSITYVQILQQQRRQKEYVD